MTTLTTPRLQPAPTSTRATDSPKESAPNALPLTPPPASPAPKRSSPSHERLLSLYLDPTLTIQDIAFTLDLPIGETITLTEKPEFLALVDRYTQAHEKRADQLLRCGRDFAARTFAHLALTCDKPETARKSAGAMLRMSEQEARNRATDRLPKRSAPSASPPPSPRLASHRSAALRLTQPAAPLRQSLSRTPQVASRKTQPTPPAILPRNTPSSAAQLIKRGGSA